MTNIKKFLFIDICKYCKCNILNEKYKKIFNTSHIGFTLAEMMVVMLILSIIMAAMAPVMTTRNKLDQSSPWVWADNGSDAYYGIGNAQIAMIGQAKALDTDTGARLLINTAGTKDHILFKSNEDVVGRLRMVNKGILLGTTTTTPGSNSTGVGADIKVSGDYSTAIGGSSEATNTYSTAIGYLARALEYTTSAFGVQSLAEAKRSTAIGYGAKSYGEYSLAMGASPIAYKNYSIAMGASPIANGEYSIAIGSGDPVYTPKTQTQGDYSIAIGHAANSSQDSGVAIGHAAKATKSGGVAIGHSSQATGIVGVAISDTAKAQGDYSISLGRYSLASGLGSIALGSSSSSESPSTYNTQAQGTSSIAIGDYSQAQGNYSISMGKSASAAQNDGIAIGEYAKAAMIGSIAIGESAKAGKSDKLTGTYATSLGYYAEAFGNESLALGAGAQAAGASSIAIGAGAKAAGKNNIAIGAYACTNAKGNNVTCIGPDSGPKDILSELFKGLDNVMYLGNSDTTVYIPGRLVVGRQVFLNLNEGAVVLRRANGRDLGVIRSDDMDDDNDNLRHYPEDLDWNGDLDGLNWYGTWYGYMLSLSDRRLKYVGKESTSGLDKIRQLKVFNYTFKKDDKKTPHVGVIAQDLQKVFPDAVSKAKDGFLKIRLEDMFYAMVNAIKELDAKYQAQEKRINELEKRIEKLEAQVK